MRIRLAIASTVISLAAATTAPAQVVVNEVMASNLATVPDMVDHGDFADWIELYNAGGADMDLGGYALADAPVPTAPWTFPAGTILPAGGHLVVWADGEDDIPGAMHTREWWPAGQAYVTRHHHTDFRLDQQGDGVYLFAPGGTLADSVTFGAQLTDVSIARYPDGSATWRQFAEATPGMPNAGAPLVDATPGPEVAVAPPGGFFAGPLQVFLGADGVPVHYTTDGSIPTSSDPVVPGPVTVVSTTVLRARAIEPGRLPGPVTSQTYFVGEPRTLPVVSISTPPAWLWDRDLGIYLNSYKDREIPVGFEYYPEGEQVLSVSAGARIGGENIFRFAQKPFNLYFRSEYGASRLDWPVFADLPYFDYKRIYVRNGGDDWPGTLFRDGLVRELLKDRVTNAMQAFRPATLYLNGAYWGIHNLREKIDERWFELHHGTVPADLDHLESDGTVITGDSADYQALLSFAGTADLSDPSAWSGFESQVDVGELIDFVAVQSIISNRSWGHNREMWRDRGADARWRWVIVDTDRGFDTAHLQDDMLLDQFGSFELFSSALASPVFRERFVRRTALLLNTTFRPDRVVRAVDSLRTLIAPEIPRHAGRWSTYIDSLTIDVWGRTAGIQSAAAWEAEVDELRTFAQARPPVVRDQVVRLFGLDGVARVTVGSEPAGAGRVRVEGEPVDDGTYFLGVPVHLDAEAAPGLSFSRWMQRSLGSRIPVVPLGSVWRYLDYGTTPADWADPSFDDSAWPQGEAQLGYGDGDEATVVSYGTDPSNKRITTYFRRSFQAPDPVDLVGLDLGLIVDDGAVVYLNGTEIVREGMPAGTITYTTRASTSPDEAAESFVHRYSIPADLLSAGENVLAVEVHQVSSSSSDISFDLDLSARYRFAEPVESVASVKASFDYVPHADADLVAMFDPVEAAIVPSDVSTTTVMETSRSPWYVDGTVRVAPGAALLAEPGVEVLMTPGSGLLVEGRLEFAGTPELPVRVRSLYAGERWGTICIQGGEEWSVLENVLISGSGEGPDPCPAAVTASGTRLRLQRVTFDDVHLPVKADDTELEILDSRFGGVSGTGDYVEINGGRLLLEGSDFAGNDLVDMDGVDMGFMHAGTEIRGNRFHDFTGFNSDGVDLGDASVDIVVEDNLFHDCQDKAVSVGQGSTVMMARNVVVRCGIGVGVKDSLSSATVVHSTFHDTGIGVAVYEKHPERGGASATVTGSLFSRSGTASIRVDELSTIDVRYSLSDTDDLPGATNLRGDPHMLDPDGLNTALQVVSPAIDAADPADPIDPDGTRSDIGALPFAGTSDAPVVLNEIAYNAPADFDTGDWIELHNPTETTVDLSGWILRDEGGDPTFVFPEGAAISARSYRVLVHDPGLFAAHISGLPPPAGTLENGLDGGGEALWLYDRVGRLVDAVRYDDAWPWPTASDGNGPSLELIDPLLDNALAESWRASVGHGTPGWRNSTFVGAEGDGSDGIPASYELEQGYPNPFNPSTRIRYALPALSRVEVRVYDALGRLVRTLVDDRLDAGWHEVLWSAPDLASGVYFVSMHARTLSGGRGFHATRPSVLLR